MSLKNDISNYKKFDGKHLSAIKEYYEKCPLKDAIKQAFTGRSPNPKGKINKDSHQRRVGQKKCEAGLKELSKLNGESLIKKCKNFEELFTIIERVKQETYGLGNLWCYDTTLRIGFNLRIYPKNVYVQAGVIKGAKKVLKEKFYNSRCFPKSLFTSEFQELETYEIENFLCIWGKY